MKIELTPAKFTVPILGAGFSKAAGLPLMPELAEAVVPIEIRQIHDIFSGRDIGSPDSVDLEEILSSFDFERLLSGTIGETDGFGSRSILSMIAATIINAMGDSVEKASEQFQPFFNSAIRLLGNAEAVITTNWDTLAEIVLRLVDRQVVYRASEPPELPVLKLNGSVDWFRVAPSEGSALSDRLYAPIGDGYVRYKQFSEGPQLFFANDKTRKQMDRLQFGIVAPTHFRDLPDQFLRQVWRDAYNTLRRAEHIIVVGYSLPETDIAVRYLLQRALLVRKLQIEPLEWWNNLKIDVVDPDPHGYVEARWRSLFGDKVNLIKAGLLDVEFTVAPARAATR
jgi:hypothetical protein